MCFLTETAEIVAQGMLKGGVRGSVAGALLSIVSGAAVIVTAPIWLPFIGGTMAVSAATMTTWSAIGGIAGLCIGGGKAYYYKQKNDKIFNDLLKK